MYAEKFITALNEGYNILANNNIVEDVQYLEENNDAPCQVAIEYNFTKNEYEVIFLNLPTNENFDISDLTINEFQEKSLVELRIFKDRVLNERAYYFDTTIIENSYDEDQTKRKQLKKIFDTWNPYYKRFLNYCLSYFNGASSTFLNGISYDKNKTMNSLTCHIYPNGNFEQHKEIIENLCNLYNITLIEKHKDDLNEIINKIAPILSDGRIKLSFELSQSKSTEPEFSLIIHPIMHNFRVEVIQFVSDCLVNAGFLNDITAKQLNLWQYNEIDCERRIGFIKIKLLRDDSIKTEISSCYGVA